MFVGDDWAGNRIGRASALLRRSNAGAGLAEFLRSIRGLTTKQSVLVPVMKFMWRTCHAI